MDRPVRVERYDLLARIAAGGMGEVFLGRARGAAGFERRVAIKRVVTDAENRDELEVLLGREARLAVRLDHPNVVRVLDLVREDDTFYLVMEWVPGVDLRRLRDLSKRPLTALEAVGIVVQLLEGLRAAHGLRDPDTGTPTPIVHSDVSPHNVLLSTSGLVKLSDFGIARAAVEPVPLRAAGKVRYMAPEVLAGETPGPRADLYGAAIVLHELLAGRPPFVESDPARAIAERQGPLPELRAIRADFPKDLDPVMRRALDPDPEARYPSAEALAVALREALGGASREELDRSVADLVVSTDVPTPRDVVLAHDLTATLSANRSLVVPAATPSAETVLRRPARAQPAAATPSESASATPSPPPSRRTALVAASVIVLGLVGVGTWTFFAVRRGAPGSAATAEPAVEADDGAWRDLLPSVSDPEGTRVAVLAFDGSRAGPSEQYLVDLVPRYVADRIQLTRGIETLRLYRSANDLVRPLETAPPEAVASALGASLLVRGSVVSGDGSRGPRVEIDVRSVPEGRERSKVEIDARPLAVLNEIDSWLERRPAGLRPTRPRESLRTRDPVLVARWHQATELLQREAFDEAVPLLFDLARAVPDEESVWLALAVGAWWLKAPREQTDEILAQLERSPATASTARAVRRLLAEDACGAHEALGPESSEGESPWIEYIRAEAEFHCGRVEAAERRLAKVAETSPGFQIALHHPLDRAMMQRDAERLGSLVLRHRLHDVFSPRADEVAVVALVAVRRYDDAIRVADAGSRRFVRPTALPALIIWAELAAGRGERARDLLEDVLRGASSRVAWAANLKADEVARDIELLHGLSVSSAKRTPRPMTAERRRDHLFVRVQVLDEIREHLLGKRVERRPIQAGDDPLPQTERRIVLLANLLIPGSPRPAEAELAREPDLAALSVAARALDRGDAAGAGTAARRAIALAPDGRFWPVYQWMLWRALGSAGDEAGARATCGDLLHPPVYSPLWSAAARRCREGG